jgi:hypothetical protein
VRIEEENKINENPLIQKCKKSEKLIANSYILKLTDHLEKEEKAFHSNTV